MGDFSTVTRPSGIIAPGRSLSALVDGAKLALTSQRRRRRRSINKNKLPRVDSAIMSQAAYMRGDVTSTAIRITLFMTRRV